MQRHFSVLARLHCFWGPRYTWYPWSNNCCIDRLINENIVYVCVSVCVCVSEIRGMKSFFISQLYGPFTEMYCPAPLHVSLHIFVAYIKNIQAFCIKKNLRRHLLDYLVALVSDLLFPIIIRWLGKSTLWFLQKLDQKMNKQINKPVNKYKLHLYLTLSYRTVWKASRPN